ncbi:MAG TPA: adenylyltransferase/cytidyltransferase family protein, partial [Propionibacteriaceae bacterium]
MTVGYLADSFDLLNVGHLDLIAQANDLCSHLVVGVLSDELTERVQGVRPIVPLVERAALVAHLRGVHRVVAHAEEVLSVVDVVIYMVDAELS